jgi:hypothetical protein
MWEGQPDREIPQLLTLICSLYYYVSVYESILNEHYEVSSGDSVFRVNIYKGPSQVGSLAGAAHLLNDNAGVLWRAQTERKSVVEQKGKSSLNDNFQYEYSLRNHGLSILSL